MKYNINLINKYVEDGLVVKQNHPEYPISIYNYSRMCQYEGKWDDITLSCRGLVLDNEGNVIAKPFPKFFNYEELVGMKFRESKIPNEPFEVFEKMDGSLGIVFNYDGKWHVATKGSFTSEQAIRGAEILKKYNVEFGMYADHTYLFEIIYPENRIVVDYGGVEKMVVLGAYHTDTGVEVSVEEMVNEGFDVVKKYDGVKDFKELKDTISDNAEGYVIRFKSGMRMKIKGLEYLRLHKILTNFSTIDIWELLRDGHSLDEFLDRVPDEFDVWVRQTVGNLKYAHFAVGERAGKIHDYFRYGKYGDVDPEPTKKEFAEYVMKYVDAPLRAVCFAIWDGKPYDHIVWKLIKPKYDKPFLKNFETI